MTPEAADQHFPFLTQGSQECLLQGGKEAGNILRKDFGGGVQSLSLMSNSLQPHGLQHARLLCPSLSPRVSSNSCPLSQCCYLTISSSATPFSFYLQSQKGLKNVSSRRESSLELGDHPRARQHLPRLPPTETQTKSGRGFDDHCFCHSGGLLSRLSWSRERPHLSFPLVMRLDSAAQRQIPGREEGLSTQVHSLPPAGKARCRRARARHVLR